MNKPRTSCMVTSLIVWYSKTTIFSNAVRHEIYDRASTQTSVIMCAGFSFAIMACCWTLVPEERPEIAQLSTFLQDFYDALCHFFWVWHQNDDLCEYCSSSKFCCIMCYRCCLRVAISKSFIYCIYCFLFTRNRLMQTSVSDCSLTVYKFVFAFYVYKSWYKSIACRCSQGK